MLSLLLLVACPAPSDIPAEPPTKMAPTDASEPQPSKGPTPEGVVDAGAGLPAPMDPAAPGAAAGAGVPPPPGAPPAGAPAPDGTPVAPPADPTGDNFAPKVPAAGSTDGQPVPVHPDREFQVTGGAGVKVSGSVSYAGAQKGTIRVDFLRAQERPGFPEIVGSLTLKTPGPFSVDVPQSLGKVQIVSYIDADGNGPSAGEAFGHPAKDTYDIETTAITGINITLQDERSDK